MRRTALLILLLTSCGSEPRVSTAALAAPMVISPDGDTIRMREAARFGVLDGPAAYQLADILWLQPMQDGGVLVYDIGPGGEGGVIRSYDSTGRYQYRFGGLGEGPGEYSSFPSTTVLIDGAVMVHDQSLSRISVFDSTGKLRMTVRGPHSMVDGGPAVDGGWYVAAVTEPWEAMPRRITYFRYAADGTLTDSFPAPLGYHEGPWGSPTEARAMTIILPDGRLVSGSTDTIAFTIHGPSGDTTIARPSDRAAFHPDEKKALAATVAAMMRRAGRRPEDVDIPDLKQAYRYMVSDPSGRIIFLRQTTGRRTTPVGELRPNQTPWRISLELDIFDSTGSCRGRLKAPDDVLPRAFALGRNGAWMVHEGPDGEQIVVRWVPEREVW